MLGGVCGGLGEHIEVDPTILRFVWAVVTLLTIGTGLVAYIIAWILIPEEPVETAQSAGCEQGPG